MTHADAVRMVGALHDIAVELFAFLLCGGCLVALALLLRSKSSDVPVVPDTPYAEIEFHGRRYYVRSWSMTESTLAIEAVDDLPASRGFPLR